MNKILKLGFLVGALLVSALAIGAEVVDINRATAETMIQNWKGIGEVKARAIVAHRKKNGPFKSIDQLADVKGVGEGLIKNNRKYMSVKGGLAKPAAGKSSQSTSKSASSSKKSGSSSSSKSSKGKKDSTKSGSASQSKKSSSSSSKKSSAEKKKTTSKKKKTDKKKADKKKSTT